MDDPRGRSRPTTLLRSGALAAWALAAWALALGGARPAAPPPAPPDPAVTALRGRLNPEFAPWGPEAVYERAAEFLAAYSQARLEDTGGDLEAVGLELSYLRFFDASSVPRALLPAVTAALYYGAPSASSQPFTRTPQPVPGTDHRLFWINLCHFRWSAEAWEKVSAEDPYFREPLVPSDSEALLYVRSATQANAVVRADWFLYYTYNNVEFLKAGEVASDDAFYYQLLYADVAFERADKVQVRGTKVPQTAAEFEAFWRVDFTVLRDFPIDIGALIDEGNSGVSYRNRIVWRVRNALGVYYRTFDVFRSVGDQDFVENPFPRKFDAGEHIFQDARGAQFYFLSNGRGQRVEIGDPRLVRDHVSGAPVLLTSSSCVHCHDVGILPFKNDLAKYRDAGIKAFAYGPERSERLYQFHYQDERLRELVEDDQRQFARFVRDCNGLTPPENREQFGRARDWYQRPVGLTQAARELGGAVPELRDALGLQSAKGRLGRLALDDTAVPRLTWERGLYAEAGLLLGRWRRLPLHEQERLKRMALEGG